MGGAQSMDCRRRLTFAIWVAVAGSFVHAQSAQAAAPPAKQGAGQSSSHAAAWSWLKDKASQMLPARASSEAPQTSIADPKRPPPADSQTSMAHFAWNFEDVAASTVAARLKEYGVELPFEVGGRLTIQVSVGVPWKAPLSSEAYDLEGNLQAANLTVAGVEIRNVSARLTHDQGWLTLEHLKFQVPDSRGGVRPGEVTGSAEMQLTPPGDLTARLSLDRLPLCEARALLPDLALELSGNVTGRAEARAPVEQLHDRKRWRVRGSLAAHEIEAAGLPPATFRAAIDVADGIMQVSDVTGEAEHTQLAGSGRLQLLTPFDYSAMLRFETSKLSHLNGLHPELRLPVEIRGSFGAAIRATGSLVEHRISLTGSVTAPEVVLQGVKLQRLKFSFDANQDRLHVHPLHVGIYGGRIALSLAMPLTPEGEIKAGVRWTRLPVDRLARDAAGLDGAPEGASSGVMQLSMPVAGWHDLAAWQARGNIDLRHGAAATQTPQATAALHLADGRLRLEDLVVAAGAARLNGGAELQLHAPFGYQVALQAANVDLAWIERVAKNWRPSARLRGSLDASVDLRGALSPLHAQGQGEMSVRGLRAGALQAETASCRFAIDGERLQVRELKAALYGGSVQGALIAAISARAASEATLEFQRIDLAGVGADFATLAAPVSGILSGKLRCTAAPGALFQPATWQGATAASVREFSLAGSPGAQIELEAQAAGGLLTVSRLSARQKGGPAGQTAVLDASGKMQLAAPFAFRTAAKLTDFDLSILDGLPQNIRPPFELQGKFATTFEADGALAPLAASAQGSASIRNLHLNSAVIDSLDFDFVADDELVAFESIEASLDEGKAEGAARVPLAKDRAGAVSLTLTQLDLAHLLAGAAKLPLRLEGRVDARVEALVPPGRLADLEEWHVDAALDAAEILADSIPLGGVHARLISRNEILKYQIQGEALGGRLNLTGDWREPSAEHPQGLNEGDLKLQHVQLHHLSELLRRHGKLDSLRGVVSAECRFRHDEKTGLPVGKGRLELDDFCWNAERLADRVRGAFHLVDRRLELDELTGELADGELLAQGVVHLSADQRNLLEGQVYGADVRKLLFAWPQLAFQSRGMADLDLRLYHGHGSPWRVYGDLHLHQTEIGDVVVRSLRMPLEISFEPDRGRYDLHSRGLVMENSPGRLAGDVHVTGGHQLHFDVKGEAKNLQLQKLFRRSPSSPKGNGTVDGMFHLSGRNVRSYRDLNGRITARLRDAHGLPVLHRAHSYTGGGLSSSTRFSEGELRATLSRGIVNVERLSLSGPQTQVYATGKAALGGKLTLEVSVSANKLNPAAQGALSLATQISLLAAPPLALLLEANQFLANQVVHLQVRGALRSPSIHVRPLPLLGEEAVRFFLMQAPEP